MSLGKEIIKGLADFLKSVTEDKWIDVQDVKKEETPDGLMHTFEKKRVRIDKIHERN